MRKYSWLLVFLLTFSVINYPNPFNPKGGEITNIDCKTDKAASAFLYIYDMSARLLVKKSFDLQTGVTNRFVWNGYSDYNEKVGTGIYLYQIADQANHRLGKGKIWVINK